MMHDKGEILGGYEVDKRVRESWALYKSLLMCDVGWCRVDFGVPPLTRGFFCDLGVYHAVNQK